MGEALETLAAARAALEQFQDQALASSPLSAVDDWIRRGDAPSAESLRGLGYHQRGPREELIYVRGAFYRRWGFSIPCAEAVATLKALSPLVEIGAGTGLWSALLRAAGVDIISTDLISQGSPGYGLQVGMHCDIVAMEASAAVRAYPDRAILCSWPTKNDEWCVEAARELRSDQVLALIARQRGGTTATSSLYDMLEAEFELIGRVEIPQFPGEDDDLRVFRRLGGS